jgi:GTP cyclohydrolase I
MDLNKVAEGVTLVMEGLGLDLNDPNLEHTPERVARSYRELFAGLDNVDDQICQILARTFPCDHQQMIVAQDVEVFSLCPHHLLPVHYKITVGYLPGEGGQVIGLSKLARLTKLLAARPVLQEAMVNDITDALMEIPGCAGSACVARGAHYCMRMRGVNQPDVAVVTSSLRGSFLEDNMVRSEFMGFYK